MRQKHLMYKKPCARYNLHSNREATMIIVLRIKTNKQASLSWIKTFRFKNAAFDAENC